MKSAYENHYSVIAPLVMTSGIGDGKTTGCVMAQAATIDALRKGQTLDEPTDRMDCACPVLRRIAIRLNDANWWIDDMERTNVLRPLIPLLLDSRGDRALTDRRAAYCADRRLRRRKSTAVTLSRRCAQALPRMRGDEGQLVKLRALTAFFRLTALLCTVTQQVNRSAGRLHQWAWRRCDRENIHTLNQRQPRRERFI